MSRYLDVACPTCHAPAESFCVNASSRKPMILGHRSRQWAAMRPDGDLGPDDPDDTISPLPDLAPQPVLIDLDDGYPHLTVIRWAQEYEDTTYIYVAIKIAPLGWYLSGSTTESIPWDILWNRHLSRALWIERVATWTTLKA